MQGTSLAFAKANRGKTPVAGQHGGCVCPVRKPFLLAYYVYYTDIYAVLLLKKLIIYLDTMNDL
jgi:hypothetical protein